MKIINNVYQTTDYQIFATHFGNRAINKLHVERLKKSFQEQYLFSPIIVNEKYEIIDGQHRFEAAKQLNLPLYYIVVAGYSLREIQMLNAGTKNWEKQDYLYAYCDLGLKPYLQLKQFMAEFPDLKLHICEMLLTNTTNGANFTYKTNSGNASGSAKSMVFQNGQFEVKDYNEACANAKKIMQLKQYYDGYNRQMFVQAMLQMFKNPQFDFDVFLSKVALNPRALVPCVTVSETKKMIVEIYNYRNRNKI
jgi:hypothetical protein